MCKLQARLEAIWTSLPPYILLLDAPKQPPSKGPLALGIDNLLDIPILCEHDGATAANVTITWIIRAVRWLRAARLLLNP